MRGDVKSADPLTLGFELRHKFCRFQVGLSLILCGFAFQVIGQLLMFATFVCIVAGAGRDVAQWLYNAAIAAGAFGIGVSLTGRRSCHKHSPATSGRWLLIAAILLDGAALLAIVSPALNVVPNLREVYFLPEAASVAFFMLFLWHLADVIDRRILRWYIIASMIAGGSSVVLHLVVFILIPPARDPGPVVAVAVGDQIAILWSTAAASFAISYVVLLWRTKVVLRSFDQDLLVHATTRYLSEED